MRRQVSASNRNADTTMTPHEPIAWDLSEILAPSTRHGVIILNRPIQIHAQRLVPLWNAAAYRITVDGGTDRWYQWVEANKIDNVRAVDVVTGDMDSIKPSTLQLVRARQTPLVVITPDQDSTDFTKSLSAATDLQTKQGIRVDSVLVIVESSGRLDQTLANINTLFYARHIHTAPVFLYSETSITWLLTPGQHTIKIPESVRQLDSWCSLVPIGAACDCVTTKGFKWNLTDGAMAFGELVSTSNKFAANVVEIHGSSDILFSVGLTNDC